VRVLEEAVGVLCKGHENGYRGRENDYRNHKSIFRGRESDFEAGIVLVEVIRELFHSIRGPERSYFEA
jgi:hypothetical protein